MTSIRQIVLFLMLATVAAFGFTEQTVLIRINGDGSAVVRVRKLVNIAVKDQLTQLQVGGDSGYSLPEASAFNRDKLVAIASAMGEGVSLLRAKEINRDGRTGYLAEYNVPDITRLRVGGICEVYMASQPQFRFEFAAGPPSTLTIVPKWAAAGAPFTMPPISSPDPTIQQMLQTLFNGMLFSLYVQVNGTVIESNASHQMSQTPNAITLYYMDVATMLAAPHQIQQVMGANGSNEISALIRQNITGFIVEDPNKQILIRFQ